jgi:hypothetical protein
MHKARQMTFDILKIVRLGHKGILDVEDKVLPIGLAFIKEAFKPTTLTS